MDIRYVPSVSRPDAFQYAAYVRLTGSVNATSRRTHPFASQISSSGVSRQVTEAAQAPAAPVRFSRPAASSAH